MDAVSVAKGAKSGASLPIKVAVYSRRCHIFHFAWIVIVRGAPGVIQRLL